MFFFFKLFYFIVCLHLACDLKRDLRSIKIVIFYSTFIIKFLFLTQEEIYCTSYAVAYYLKEIVKFDKKVFTIGTTGMVEELDALNIPHTGSGVGWILFFD